MIVHGTRLTSRRRGTQLFFCPICRAPDDCPRRDFGMVNHIYFIPVSRFTAEIVELRCPHCRTRFGWTAHEFLGPGGVIHIDTQERIDLEFALAEGDIDPDLRLRLACEPFAALSYEFAVASRRGNVESLSALLVMLGLLNVVAAAICWYTWHDPVTRSPALFWWAVATSVAAAFFFLLLAGFHLMLFRRRRRTLLDKIARSLMPLRLTADEIAAIHRQLRAAHDPVALSIRTDRLIAALAD